MTDRPDDFHELPFSHGGIETLPVVHFHPGDTLAHVVDSWAGDSHWMAGLATIERDEKLLRFDNVRYDSTTWHTPLRDGDIVTGSYMLSNGHLLLFYVEMEAIEDVIPIEFL